MFKNRFARFQDVVLTSLMTNERIQVEAENRTVPVSLGGGVKIATSSSAVAKRPRDASCLSVLQHTYSEVFYY